MDELSRNYVLLTLGVALIAASSGLIGAWMARRDRDHAEQVQRRERGGEAVAPVLVLLEEANPIEVSINKSDVTPKKMQAPHEVGEPPRAPHCLRRGASLARCAPRRERTHRRGLEVAHERGLGGRSHDRRHDPLLRDDVEEGSPNWKLETARLDHRDAKERAERLRHLIQ